MFFMARDNLRQQDLPEIGNKAKVSEALSGRRAINLRQAKALSERFNVDLSLFVGRLTNPISFKKYDTSP